MLGNSEASASHGAVQGNAGASHMAGDRVTSEMPLWRWLGPVAPGAVS